MRWRLERSVGTCLAAPGLSDGVPRTAILLLDEPLANLDRELPSEMEIRRYQKELQIPFIYVTHNQEEALTMSDRIAVGHNGALEQIGAKTEIYASPATALVAGFVGRANRFEGRLPEFSGKRPWPVAPRLTVSSGLVDQSGVTLLSGFPNVKW